MYFMAEDRVPKWHFERGNHETVSRESGREKGEPPSIRQGVEGFPAQSCPTQPVSMTLISVGCPFHQRQPPWLGIMRWTWNTMRYKTGVLPQRVHSSAEG